MTLPCKACGKTFLDTDPVIVFSQKRFHIPCFNCHTCGKQIPSSAEAYDAKGWPYCIGKCATDASYDLCKGCNNPLKEGNRPI